MLKSLFKQVIFRPQQGKLPPLGPADGSPYYTHEETVRRLTARAQELRGSRYLGYPYFVHVETLASCNAACVFCPYPGLARKGTRMSDELIEKIVQDLTAIPKDLPFTFAPYKVSEPFLEVRLFGIMDLVARKLPGAKIYLSSNAAPMTDSKMDGLALQKNVGVLNLSINSDDPDEYETVMKLPFHRTFQRLEALHERARSGAYGFPIRLTRVAGGRAADERFTRWVQRNFPSFESLIIPRNDWIGSAVTPGAHDIVPDAPCHRWFDLSILATGEVAMCCMDGEGKYLKGDVRVQHALEIYNQPRLIKMRRGLPSRRVSADPCSRCTYVSW